MYIYYIYIHNLYKYIDISNRTKANMLHWWGNERD